MSYFSKTRSSCCLLAVLLQSLLWRVSAQTGFATTMAGDWRTMAMQPVQVYDDFETGEVQSWEPYPYEEDTGYDPLFSTRNEPNSPSQAVSLCRSVKANDVVSISQGFTKRLFLYATSETRFKTSLYFQTDRRPSELILTICARDGKQYTHTISGPTANQWIEIDMPIEKFHAGAQELKANMQVDAVTIVGRYDHVDYLNTYHLLMDYFGLNGQRPARCEWNTPLTTEFSNFSTTALNRFLLPGSEIIFQLAGANQSNYRITMAEVVPAKYTPNATGWKLNHTNSECILKVPQTAGPGEWHFRYTASDANGKWINDSITFYIIAKPEFPHPRLLFGREELHKRLEGPQSVTEKKILNEVLADTAFFEVIPEDIKEDSDYTAYAYTGGPFAQYYDGFQSAAKWRGPFTKLNRLINSAAFYYAFTGDVRAAGLARRAMLHLCRFSKWNNNYMLQRKLWTYFPMEQVVRTVAYGYDMIYDRLSEEDRKFIRETLMERGLRPFYRDLVVMNRMPSNITNHAAITASACGMAALAMLRDPGADPELEMILSSIIARFQTFLERAYFEDGSYAETYDYMDMASRESVDFIAALERVMGIDLTTTTHFKDCYKYPLQATYSNGMIQNFGDSYRLNKGFTQAHGIWLVYRTGNPFLFPFVQRFLAEGNGGYLGYLWYRDDVAPRYREELPVSRVFSNKGMVIRSGWSDSSVVIPIRIGPHGNHMHFDQGNFQVMIDGEELLTDPSIGELRYYQDLEYVVYNIQAIGHNVLTVDHNPESQAPADFNTGIAALSNWPVVSESFTGTTTDYIRSELSSVYKNKLKSYYRSLLYCKGGLLYAIDQVQSGDGQPHIYNLNYHVPYIGTRSAARLKGERQLDIDQQHTAMDMKLAGPIDESRRKEKTSHKFSETIVSFHTKPLISANLVTVMYPYIRKNGAGQRREMLTVKESKQPGWQIVHAEIPGSREDLFIRTDSLAGKAGNFVTDAKVFLVGADTSGTYTRYFFTGLEFSDGIRTVHAGMPVQFSASKDKAKTGEWLLEIKVPAATMIQIGWGKRGQLLSIDGRQVTRKQQAAFHSGGNIDLPAGTTTIRLKNVE